MFLPGCVCVGLWPAPPGELMRGCIRLTSDPHAPSGAGMCRHIHIYTSEVHHQFNLVCCSWHAWSEITQLPSTLCLSHFTLFGFVGFGGCHSSSVLLCRWFCVLKATVQVNVTSWQDVASEVAYLTRVCACVYLCRQLKRLLL